MHDVGEQLHTTLFDIAVNKAVANVGARRRVLLSPRDQEVPKCILRMSKWADMAKAAVEAEIPDLLVVTVVVCLCFGS